MKKGKNIFWGILFVLGALALIVGQLGYLENIGFWSILFSVVLIGFFVDGFYHRSFGVILFSLAFLAILHSKWLGIEKLTPWPVIGAAVLGTIGLNIIFPKAARWKKYVRFNKNKDAWDEHRDGLSRDGAEYVDGEKIHFSSHFGDSVKYVTSRELSYGNLENAFGSLTIYFDNTGLKNGAANLTMDCAFGNITLYIPADWRVIISVSNVFGGVNEHGKCNPAGADCLQIVGDVVFGALEVHYI